MALLAILARTTGRVYEITWALFVTAFLMVLHNPKILRFDTSFQLSFLATLSLIYLSPKLKEKFTWITEKWQLREIVASTVSAQVFVLPLLLYKIGNLSLVALPVNFLILVFVPLTMMLVFLAGGVGMFSALLAIPLGWVSYLLLRYEIFIVEIFARLPFASINIKYFPLWLMVAVYAVYAILIFRINGKSKTTS
jgi:competence protein ComEC